MAFPTISDADTKNGTVTSNSTSWTITYCTNIASGDLLLLFLASDGVQAFTATGWTEIRQAATTPVSLSLMAKVAAGTETGTFTATAAFTEQGGWRMFRIPAAGWLGGTLPSADADPTVQKDANGIAVSAMASGASNVPNPPNLDPANWATEDTLWIAAMAADTSRTISVYPYATRNTADVSGGSTGATLGLCTTTSTSGSLDPGTFTISASDDWSAITVAIRPAGAGSTPLTQACSDDLNAIF